MGPVGNQRKMIAFLTACLAVTASGSISAQAEDSKWDSEVSQMDDKPLLDIKLSAPMATLVDGIMVDKLLAEAELNDSKYSEAVTSFKDVIRRLSRLLPASDIRVLSSNYSLACALALSGDCRKAAKILRPALKLELERERTAQKSERKYISEAERLSEGMETTAHFDSRYASAEQLIKDDLEMALLDRSLILFWNGRPLDALHLALVSRLLMGVTSDNKSTAKRSEGLYIQALSSWSIGERENFQALRDELLCLTSGRPETHLCAQLLNGLALQSEKRYDEAQTVFENALKSSDSAIAVGLRDFSSVTALKSNSLNLNLLKLFLGNNFLLKGEPALAYELFERVYEEARRLDKGKPDSVIYADVYSAALDGMESSVLSRYTMSMPPFFEFVSSFKDETPKFSSHIVNLSDTANGVTEVKLSDFEYRKLAGDLYTVAYQRKLKNRQRQARDLFYRGLEVYEQRLPECKPEIAGLLYDLAESYYWSKQYDAAIGVMKKCVAVRKEIDPVSRDTMASLNQLGRMYQSNGEGKEAVECFREALALLCRERELSRSRVYKIAAEIGLSTDRFGAGRPGGAANRMISDTVSEKLIVGKPRKTLDTTYDADKIGLICSKPLAGQLSAIAYAVSSAPPSERGELNDLWQVLADAYNIGKHYDESYETSLGLLETRKQVSGSTLDPADLTDNLWQLAYICSVSFRLEDAKKYFDEVVRHHKPLNERTTGYLHYSRGLVNDSNGLAKEAVADFRIAVKCLKNYLPTLHPINEAEEIDHTRWLIYDIEQEIKAKKKRGADAPDYYGAYDSTKWARDRFPLKICIDQTPEHGFGPRLHSSFTKSIDEWMSASSLTDDSPLSYELIDDKEKADIYLERVESFDQIPYGSGGGATARYVMKHGKPTKELDLVHLRVYCQTPDPDELSNYAIAQLEGLVLHELGHAFGLGHSSSGLDIMYWKSAAKNLSHRDKATLLRIYGCRVKR